MSGYFQERKADGYPLSSVFAPHKTKTPYIENRFAKKLAGTGSTSFYLKTFVIRASPETFHRLIRINNRTTICLSTVLNMWKWRLRLEWRKVANRADIIPQADNFYIIRVIRGYNYHTIVHFTVHNIICE